ncbi:DUF1491 family protein [Novosphingobium flavum]|uniref:DUF1491 family protein n=1 Tax=Novosphingobium flavum TaxID=1778672 RepID=A0A7X1FPN8_9SPHN|nr:DUF1491 family protein [Novosphingobium flavum]MBC2664554.1 DUF1491 family protein [Novosphingobium flavum]
MTDSSEEARLPAHIEVGGLLRRVQQEGGFGMVLAKGEPEAGTILIVLVENGSDQRAWERMPDPSGGRRWTLSRAESREEPGAFSEWLDRRRRQDPDLWIVELDIPKPERFIPGRPNPG